MRHSILFTLAFGVILIGVGLLVAVPREVKRSVRENLTEEFDAGVLAKARALGPLVEYEGGTYEFDHSVENVATLSEYFEARGGDGVLLARSEGTPLRVPAGRGGWTPFFFDVRAPDGRALRCVALRVKAVVDDDGDDGDAADDDTGGGLPPAAGDAIAAPDAVGAVPFADIVVGVGRDEIDSRIAAVSAVIDGQLQFLAIVILIVVSAGVFWTWRAIGGVTKNLAAAPATGLGPIEWKPRPPRELRPLTEALDGALADAGAAVERERDVIAGMAHELRTPVAEMLATTEIALDRAGSAGGLRPALVDTRQVALQMKETVETMLRVARGRAPGDTSRIEDLDVVPLWNDVVAGTESKASPRGVTFVRRGSDTAAARCDPAALRIVLTTLAENAALHAPAGSEVDVAVRDGADGIRVEVSNPAPHLDDSDVARLTEPLWHKTGGDASYRGLGLGLYLASEVAGHADLTLDLKRTDGRLVVGVGIPKPAPR